MFRIPALSKIFLELETRKPITEVLSHNGQNWSNYPPI